LFSTPGKTFLLADRDDRAYATRLRLSSSSSVRYVLWLNGAF